MACGGCRGKVERLLRSINATDSTSQSPQAILMCPACKVHHTEQEYQNCPFRLQLVRQQTDQERIRILQPVQVVAAPTPSPFSDRRSTKTVAAPQGRQPTKPSPSMPNPRKW